MAKNSSIGSSLYFEYFSGMACSDKSALESMKADAFGTFAYSEKLYVVKDMIIE